MSRRRGVAARASVPARVLAMVLLATGAAGAARAQPAASAGAPVVSGDRIPLPLAGPGSVERGRAIVLERERGACLLCHRVPEPQVRFHGDIAPPLDGVGARLDAGQLRLRVVDTRRLNPQSPMPSYYRVDGLSRVAPQYRGRPLLQPQDVEDVVAYLGTLR